MNDHLIKFVVGAIIFIVSIQAARQLDIKRKDKWQSYRNRLTIFFFVLLFGIGLNDLIRSFEKH